MNTLLTTTKTSYTYEVAPFIPFVRIAAHDPLLRGFFYYSSSLILIQSDLMKKSLFADYGMPSLSL